MKYTVCANLCDGSDYVTHWEGGKFDDLDEAREFFVNWWPPESEVKDELRLANEEGDDITEYDLQIGLWDEDGDDLEFWSEGFEMEDLA